MKTFFLISLCLVGLLLFNVQEKVIAEDVDYTYVEDTDYKNMFIDEGIGLEREIKARASDEDDEEKESALMAKKKDKKKKKKGAKLKPDVISCLPPVCTIKDAHLPPEICQNECLEGSGYHCEGRHYTKPVPLNIAFCIPD